MMALRQQTEGVLDRMSLAPGRVRDQIGFVILVM
jgi:hypothetical protein